MNKEILIVDDVEGVRREIGFLFEDEGYNVTLAANGEEALTILSQKTIQIMISDILMPIMDGIELSMQVRKLFPEVKVVLISGGGKTYSKDSSMINGLLSQAKKLSSPDAIIKKPFKSKQLLDCVKAIF